MGPGWLLCTPQRPGRPPTESDMVPVSAGPWGRDPVLTRCPPSCHPPARHRETPPSPSCVESSCAFEPGIWAQVCNTPVMTLPLESAQPHNASWRAQGLHGPCLAATHPRCFCGIQPDPGDFLALYWEASQGLLSSVINPATAPDCKSDSMFPGSR